MTPAEYLESEFNKLWDERGDILPWVGDTELYMIREHGSWAGAMISLEKDHGNLNLWEITSRDATLMTKDDPERITGLRAAYMDIRSDRSHP